MGGLSAEERKFLGLPSEDEEEEEEEEEEEDNEDADSSAILNSKQASGFAVSTNSDVLCVEAFPDQLADQQTDKPAATSASVTSNRSAFAARQQLKRKLENT